MLQIFDSITNFYVEKYFKKSTNILLRIDSYTENTKYNL